MVSDCEELVGKIILEMTGVGHSVKKTSKHVQNFPSMTEECQYTFATNYFMYQWAGPVPPTPLQSSCISTKPVYSGIGGAPDRT